MKLEDFLLMKLKNGRSMCDNMAELIVTSDVPLTPTFQIKQSSDQSALTELSVFYGICLGLGMAVDMPEEDVKTTVYQAMQPMVELHMEVTKWTKPKMN